MIDLLLLGGGEGWGISIFFAAHDLPPALKKNIRFSFRMIHLSQVFKPSIGM